MKNRRVKAAWAKNAAGDVVHIDSVSNGLKCGCICVDCGGKMVARQNGNKAPHFAHHTHVDCSGESALHAAAKQIILNAAMTGQIITRPNTAESVQYIDHFDISHQRYLPPTPPATLSGAETEVRRGDVIVDVLCKTASTKFAVEIHFRHAKSECDVLKFKRMGLECFEIDISQVDWDISPEALEEFVLHTAARKWICFNKSHLQEQQTLQSLQEYVDGKNRDKFNSMFYWLRAMTESLDFQDITLPSLSYTTSSTDFMGKRERLKHTEEFKITGVKGAVSINEKEYTYCIPVEINSKTTVMLYLFPPETPFSSNDDRPSLVQYYSFEYDEVVTKRSHWVNVETWKKKLVKKAKCQLSRKLADREDYLTRFKSMSDEKKVHFLSKSLGVPVPSPMSLTGRYSHPWNTRDFVWKALVVECFLRKKKECSTDVIATDKWMLALLNAKDNELQAEKRSKSIYFWFKNTLAPLGIVTHQSRLSWHVNKQSAILFSEHGLKSIVCAVEP
ncbi:competence protein CoiA family protein [Motilimonas pumila]|uniref:Competence protein CoiA n=1 Tax=Motilimonas pumila TaxID=2303987 RepID=A0A418YA51_9GAMM|nr:competence protein CoiA family protein [Motilimonas pumila]RJG38791.1 hypothetical protein D1Z90_18780 [Motilimonas pumila]